MRYFVILILVLVMTCGEPPTSDIPCQGEKDPTKACLMVENPICGCDGKTYVNACFASKNGVSKYKEGECK